MNLTCPASPDHKKFTVTAHITEDWVVDPQGNFLEVSPSNDPQVLHEPDPHDLYECAECGTTAKVNR